MLPLAALLCRISFNRLEGDFPFALASYPDLYALSLNNNQLRQALRADAGADAWTDAALAVTRWPACMHIWSSTAELQAVLLRARSLPPKAQAEAACNGR